MYACSIVGCKYFGFAPNDVRFFFVSKTHSELVKKWVASIRTYMPDFPNEMSNHRICQLHFDPMDLKLSRGELQLRFGAIPKRFPRLDEAPPQRILLKKVSVSSQKVPTLNQKPYESIGQPSSSRPAQDPLSISRNPQNVAAISDDNTKCADCRMQIQTLQKRMHTLQRQIKEQQYDIATLHKRNQYLKTFEPMVVEKSEECYVCALKLTTDELYLHLCQQQLNNNESGIRCEYCLKSFSSTMKLLNHLRSMHNNTLERRFYRCEECPKLFRMFNLLDIHMRTHLIEMSNKKIIQKQICPENNVLKTQQHQPETEDPFSKPFQCGHSNCSERFGSSKLLQEHMTKNHGTLRTKDIITNIELKNRKEKVSFECYLCRGSFDEFIEFRCHMNKHFESSTSIGRRTKIKCSVCWIKFSDTQVLNEHLCEHIARCSGDSIDCEYCPEKLMSIVKLFEHVNTKHSEIKTLYRCIANCSSTFSVKSLLEYHQVVHTQEIYKCDKCCTVRAFRTLDALNQHIKQHETDKVYLCEDCGKAFKSIYYLKNHKISQHTNGEPQYKCDQCPKKFSTAMLLKKHKSFHSNQTYSCHLCHVKCTSSHRLLAHIKHHTEPKEKRFECSMCTVKFTKNSKLKHHMSTVHTTIRQFQCVYCPNRSYKHKGDLNKHLRTHLGDDMYACPDCPKRFRLQIDLQKHASEHYVEGRNMENID